MTQFHRSRTVAFSGHRSFKIASREAPEQIAVRLRDALRGLCNEGCDTFLSGMAEGFDLLAARAVIALKEEYEHIKFVAVVPFAGQAERFGRDVAMEYSRIISAADQVVTLCQEYDAGCFHRRNDFLLDNASRLVCYYNGSAGGTRYCWEQALKRGLRPINLFGQSSEGFLF